LIVYFYFMIIFSVHYYLRPGDEKSSVKYYGFKYVSSTSLIVHSTEIHVANNDESNDEITDVRNEK
jgi:hypothetical protein